MLAALLLNKVSPRRLTHILAGILLGAGVLHFVYPKPFDSIVPKEIPGDPRTLTYASGVAEIAVGAGLLVDRTRKPAAGAAAALFLAVFPANVNMVRQWWRKPLIYKVIALGRLPLQMPLVAAAIRVFRNS